ncbi:MAG: ABC transporter permease [Eubacteriales bacterium]|nr:ABC transporter permease [Eubacteriales bacterium]
MIKKIWKAEIIVPVLFILIDILCFILSRVSTGFLVEQVSVRFIRNGVLVLSLILPVVAGMGLNFCVTVGAMAAQAAYIISLNHNLYGGPGVLAVFVMTIIFNLIIGFVLGKIMNLVKGKEMVTSIVIGSLSNYLYQLIFIAGYGTILPVHNENIILKNGVGVESMVDLKTYKEFFNSFGSVKVAQIPISIFLIFMVFLLAFGMFYLLHTPFGKQVQVMGYDEKKAQTLGIPIDRYRIYVMIASSVLAGIGQFIYLQNIGTLNTYTEHLNVDTFSCAALLVGGASIRRANVKNAMVGVLIMHTLFVVSSIAGQNLFANTALGEYFRSFVVYGIITFALIMNLRIENKKRMTG